MSGIFLWPEAAPLRPRHFRGPVGTMDALEARLRSAYPAEAVLFSSARAGLSAVLEHLGLNRPKLVWCPPYSSHCVFDAISRVATPTTLATEAPDAALIYHQWGHVHRHHFAETTPLIEDAVDSLILPGTSPFAAGGRFALWSLPKVVGSLWGGVVFCRCADDAAALRRRRDARPLPSTLQSVLRLLGERHPVAAGYWHGAEAGGGRLPAFALRHIAEGLDRLPDLADIRQRNLAVFQPHSLAPPPPPERLPSNLPLPAVAALAEPLPSGRTLTAGLRNFNLDRDAPGGRWSPVFPVPLHREFDGTDVAEILARVTSSQRFQPR